MILSCPFCLVSHETEIGLRSHLRRVHGHINLDDVMSSVYANICNTNGTSGQHSNRDSLCGGRALPVNGRLHVTTDSHIIDSSQVPMSVEQDEVCTNDHFRRNDQGHIIPTRNVSFDVFDYYTEYGDTSTPFFDSVPDPVPSPEDLPSAIRQILEFVVDEALSSRQVLSLYNMCTSLGTVDGTRLQDSFRTYRSFITYINRERRVMENVDENDTMV